MSIFYNKIKKLQTGGKTTVKAIDEIESENTFDDTDAFFDDSHAAPIEDYNVFRYNDLYTEPSEETAYSQESPVTHKVGNDTFKPTPYMNVFRDNLPFENEFEWMRYRDFINEKELSGRKDAKALKHFNKYGYVGPYQLGTMALQEANILKKNLHGKGQKAKIMDPANWIGGKASQDAFFGNARIQEDALKRYTARNFRYIKETLRTHGITDKDTIMGYLAGTHLAGQKNVKKYIRENGSNFVDANGTSIDVYRNGFRKWIKDEYKDGQGLRRYFDKRKAEETLKQKGIHIQRVDYFPEDYRVPGNKTQPWQDSD